MEPSCCAVMRKMGGKKCPICGKSIKLAIVLRMLRHDARSWWWYRTLRANGRTPEAIVLERQSIRRDVQFIRENIGRDATTHRTDVIEFLDRPRMRPFDLQSIPRTTSVTMSMSGCHTGIFAAWVYCYAHRIGLKFTAKEYDLV
jgi:hypothetical protein